MTRTVVDEIEQLHSAADLLRGHPDHAAPGKATEVIRSLLNGSPRLRVLARWAHSHSVTGLGPADEAVPIIISFGRKAAASLDCASYSSGLDGD